jgi:hypothetical protein
MVDGGDVKGGGGGALEGGGGAQEVCGEGVEGEGVEGEGVEGEDDPEMVSLQLQGGKEAWGGDDAR